MERRFDVNAPKCVWEKIMMGFDGIVDERQKSGSELKWQIGASCRSSTERTGDGMWPIEKWRYTNSMADLAIE